MEMEQGTTNIDLHEANHLHETKENGTNDVATGGIVQISEERRIEITNEMVKVYLFDWNYWDFCFLFN